MESTHEDQPQSVQRQIEAHTWRVKAGFLLVFTGIILLLDSLLKTGWLAWLLLPAFGLFFLIDSLRRRRLGWMITGCLLASLGVGGFLAFSSLFGFTTGERVGWLLLAFGCGWMMITLLSLGFSRDTAWWALIPGATLAGSGVALLAVPLHWPNFALYVGVGLGTALLVWGLASRLFGLIIPGSLLVGIGLGVYFGWATPGEQNAVARTGIMLVGFALGWGLVTFFSRRVTPRFLWWPLIPGGVLAVTGWGLYIGGNPGNALSFIGNTGSLALILFGLYLLLLRRGIHS